MIDIDLKNQKVLNHFPVTFAIDVDVGTIFNFPVSAEFLQYCSPLKYANFFYLPPLSHKCTPSK